MKATSDEQFMNLYYRYSGETWIMEDGTPILITDLEDDHLDNCINLLYSRAEAGSATFRSLIIEKVKRIEAVIADAEHTKNYNEAMASEKGC